METTSPNLRYSATHYPSRHDGHKPTTLCMTTAAIMLTLGSAISVIMLGANEMMTTAAHAGAVEQLTEIQWAVFPLGGALAAGAMALLFKREDWRETLGRFIGALVSGVAVPRFITYIHPALKEWSLDPILIFGFGFVWGLLGYACAKWAVNYSFRRAPQIAEVTAEDWQHRRRKNQGQETEKLKP